jgi:uncharacterized protein YhaN
MWVESVRVTGIGGFGEERAFNFDRGWTVVTGGNESGKTTIAAVIARSLFGRAEVSVSIAPQGEARAEVVFHAGRHRYVVHRDFRSDRVKLARLEAEGRETMLFEGDPADPQWDLAYRTRLEGLFGIGEGTAWRRGGLVLDGRVDTELDAGVRAWMSGSPRGEYETVLSRLGEERDRLCARNGDGPPGELDEVREEIEQRRAEVESWEERSLALIRVTAEVGERTREREAAEEEVLRQEEILVNITRFDELTRDRARLEENLLALRHEQDRIRTQVEAVEAGQARLEKEFADFLDAPGDVEECLQVWTETAARRNDLTRDLERAEETMTRLPATRTRRNGGIAASVVAILGWLGCAGAGAMGLGFFLIPFFAAAGYGAVWYLDRNAERIRLSGQEEQVRLAAELEELDHREREARAGLGRLAAFGEPSTLRVEFKHFLEAQSALDRAESARDSHRPFSEVVDAYEEVFRELQILDTQTRDLVARARYLSGLDADLQTLAIEMEKARAAGEEAKQRAAALAGEVESLRAEVTRAEAETVLPGRAWEDLARLEERERGLAARHLALTRALEALTDAVGTYHDNHLDRVTERASEYFRRFSLRRYRAVRFGDDMKIEVQNGRAAWIGESDLSAATRGQLHVAVRIAVNEELHGDRGLPLILDEAFLAWDDARLEEARNVIESLAEAGRQVIVLSADPRLHGWGEDVLTLSGPSKAPSRGRRKAA